MYVTAWRQFRVASGARMLEVPEGQGLATSAFSHLHVFSCVAWPHQRYLSQLSSTAATPLKLFSPLRRGGTKLAALRNAWQKVPRLILDSEPLHTSHLLDAAQRQPVRDNSRTVARVFVLIYPRAQSLDPPRVHWLYDRLLDTAGATRRRAADLRVRHQGVTD